MTLPEVIVNLQNVMNTDPRDWSTNKRDAYLYGVIVGWGSAMKEVAKQHNWSDDTVERIKRGHKAIKKAKKHE